MLLTSIQIKVFSLLYVNTKKTGEKKPKQNTNKQQQQQQTGKKADKWRCLANRHTVTGINT